MTESREARKRELWKLTQTPAGMLELIRLHGAETGEPTGMETEQVTADVGPLIDRILDREFPPVGHTAAQTP